MILKNYEAIGILLPRRGKFIMTKLKSPLFSINSFSKLTSVVKFELMSRNETEEPVSVVSFTSCYVGYINGIQLAKRSIIN